MGIVGYLTHGPDGWTLSAPGGDHVSQSFDEATAAAQRLLGPHGGGTVYVSKGPGVEATTLRIPPHPAAANVAPLMGALRPIGQAAPSKSPTPEPVTAPAPSDGSFKDDILELCGSYRRAEEEIREIAEPIERDLSRGTLRLEASEALRRLQGSSPSPSQEDLTALRDTVGQLSGGKASEITVKGVDAAGRQILKEFRKSLMALELTSVASFLLGLFVAYFGWSVEIGTSFALLLASGTSVGAYALRQAIIHGPGILEDSFLETTGWALRIGSRAQPILQKPRQIQQRLLASRTALPASQYKPLLTRAHDQAVVIVALFWVCVGVGFVGFLIGFIGFFNK